MSSARFPPLLTGLNIWFAFLTASYAVFLIDVAQQQGGPGPMMSIAMEASIVVLYGVALWQSFRVYRKGKKGLAYFLSVGGFFMSLFLLFGACLASLSLKLAVSPNIRVFA